MPTVMEAIDHMTTSEKFETIDYLLSSISKAGEHTSPAWYERELKKTQARVAAGIERSISWTAAKEILKGAFL